MFRPIGRGLNCGLATRQSETAGGPANSCRASGPAIVGSFDSLGPKPRPLLAPLSRAIVLRATRMAEEPAPAGARSSSYLSKVRGCILAGMCGDVLGAAVEGLSANQVIRSCPNGCTAYMGSDRGYGCYTDDTEMALSLALTLVKQSAALKASGQPLKTAPLDVRATGLAYGAAFDPMRGYGGTAQKVLALIVQGADPTTTGDLFLPGGSFANGGAMRIAPLGLAFRNATPEALYDAVKAALQPTHTHPEAVAGALVQAAAVAWLQKQPLRDLSGSGAGTTSTTSTSSTSSSSRVTDPAQGGPHGEGCGPPRAGGGQSSAAGGSAVAAAQGAGAVLSEGWGPAALLAHLQGVCAPYSPEMSSKVATLAEAYASRVVVVVGGLQGRWGEYFESRNWDEELRVAQLVAPGFQIRATDAVAAALWALVCHWEQPEDAVVAAVHYGGDTDTIASMVGALVGALHGEGWIPGRWIRDLENGSPPGASQVAAAADGAAAGVVAATAPADSSGPGAAAGVGAAAGAVLQWPSTMCIGRDAALRLAEALAEVDWS